MSIIIISSINFYVELFAFLESVQGPGDVSAVVKKIFTGHIIYINWTYHTSANQFTIKICHSQSSVCLDVIESTYKNPTQRDFTYNLTVEPQLSPGIYDIKISEVNASTDEKPGSSSFSVGKSLYWMREKV